MKKIIAKLDYSAEKVIDLLKNGYELIEVTGIEEFDCDDKKVFTEKDEILENPSLIEDGYTKIEIVRVNIPSNEIEIISNDETLTKNADMEYVYLFLS